MASIQRQIRRGAEWGPSGVLHLERIKLDERDVAWMLNAVHIEARSIAAPFNFFASLPNLKFLQIYGGTETTIEMVRGSQSLQYLEVWNMRGLTNLEAVSTLTSLEFLSLYGLQRVRTIPSLGRLKSLKRVDLGRMSTLEEIGPVLEAPNLKELTFVNEMGLGLSEATRIARSPLEYFTWYAEDVPDKTWVPFVEASGKEPPEPLNAEDWFSVNHCSPTTPPPAESP